MQIVLTQLVGKCRGLVKAEPLDIIYVHTEGKLIKLGYIARVDGAGIAFITYQLPEEYELVHKEVSRLRLEQHGWETSPHYGRIPNPALIQAYVRGELHKKPKTSIVMPSGEPFDDESEGDFDE